MKHQNKHIKQFAIGLLLLLSYQASAQFVLEAPVTNSTDGTISNYRWFVQDGSSDNASDAVLLKESETDNTLEVFLPGVYYAVYDGTICGKNTSDYFILTYCSSPENEVTLDISSSVSSNATVSWNNSSLGVNKAPKVIADNTKQKYEATVTKAGNLIELPTFFVACFGEQFELVDDIVAVLDDNPTGKTIIKMTENDISLPSMGVFDYTNPSHGTIELFGQETLDPNDDYFVYTPGTSFVGYDEFTYQLSMLDQYNVEQTNSATVTIDLIHAANDKLTVLEDSQTGNDNQIDVSDNDNIGGNGSGGDDYALATAPVNGTVTEVSDGVFEYIPNENFNGLDFFIYTLTDAAGNEVSATVSVQVTPINDDPIAVDDVKSTNGDIVSIDVLINDTDIDGDPLSVSDYTALSDHGLVEENTPGILTYTPEPGFVGQDCFEYTVSDGNGGSDTAEVCITVGEGDGKGVLAENDEGEMEEDTVLTINVLANDDLGGITDYEVEVEPAITNGSAYVNTNNEIVFTPHPDFVGPITFPYSINYTDLTGNQDSSSAFVSIQVTPVNDVEDDFYDVDSSYPSEVIFNVLGNDTFNEDTKLEMVSVSDPLNGTITVNPDNTISYVVNPGFEGPDIFAYIVRVIHEDGTGRNEQQGIITVNASPLSPPPAPPAPEEDLRVHQLITANGDGRNDELKIYGIEDYPDNTVKIFNRWGVLVYETEGYGQSSNTFRGYSEGRVTVGQRNKLPVGTYYYTIEYIKEETRKSMAGYIYLNY
ncbi:tandem-95 repeat protein [Joostella atrarenae]|uniref:Tandem-95 repeat protein n=1 Tax=Joostella atrarenae TaxID=679257 RepID=A0ABS9J6T3_9FLAO|nr:Ig-like domain-containing protein [Joostella atrarenae]MCF8716152.1 tandem-95 repeat protein [Joostella atrarenae]